MSQIEKNTVSAKDQLNGKGSIAYVGEKKDSMRVLFVGNSITWHAVKEDIGWSGNWGMAASDISKDYVHILVGKIREKNPDASFCIAQVADWETHYFCGEEKLPMYEEAREFNADIIIFRCIENCPYQDMDVAKFKEEYQKLIDYFNPEGKAKIILTTGFWKHTGDAAIRETAIEKNYKLAELGDLGELDEMKAIGLFEHSGVANHPGDKGMEKIAERIFELI